MKTFRLILILSLLAGAFTSAYAARFNSNDPNMSYAMNTGSMTEASDLMEPKQDGECPGCANIATAARLDRSTNPTANTNGPSTEAGVVNEDDN